MQSRQPQSRLPASVAAAVDEERNIRAPERSRGPEHTDAGYHSELLHHHSTNTDVEQSVRWLLYARAR
jgi:hypothetical protein